MQKITDIFGYIPGEIFSLSRIEEIFYENLCSGTKSEISGKLVTVVWDEKAELTEYYAKTINYLFKGDEKDSELLDNMMKVTKSYNKIAPHSFR